jgi:hypothetical protein
MEFEFFDTRSRSIEDPAVSISRRGILLFNRHAVEILRKVKATAMLLGFNRQAMTVAFQVPKDPDFRAAKIVYGTRERDKNSAAVTATAFCKHIGYDLSTPRKFPLTWNAKENRFEFRLDEGAIKRTKK